MLQIWENMSLLSQVFTIMAMPATIILLIQTILLFFGHGGHDSDLDSDISGIGDNDVSDLNYDTHDGSHFDAAGLRLFSVRGIFAFFSIGGWVGLLCSESGMNGVIASFIAFVCGFISLLAIAKIMQSMMKLQESGNIDYRRAVGLEARVYLTIPSETKGQGKINVELSGAMGEFSAVTKSANAIKTGELVRITDVVGDTFIVEPVL